MRLNFVPAQHGFHFENSFTNHLIAGITTYGRCGGMVYASLDYYLNGMSIPTHNADDYVAGGRSDGVPADGTRLADYIYGRLLNSILNLSGGRFISWRLPWNTDDVCFGYTVHYEFNHLRDRLDHNQLTPLGLVSRGEIGGDHQVLAYGYELDPIRVYIYDNNFPDEEITLCPESSSAGVIAKHSDGSNAYPATWRGFFVHDDYNLAAPPRPTYLDLVVTEGVKLTPPSPVNRGASVDFDVTVTNKGDYRAGFNLLYPYEHGYTPLYENDDDQLGGAVPGLTTLEAGASTRIQRTVASFGREAGNYEVGVSYLSRQNNWMPVPPYNGQALNPVKPYTVNASWTKIIAPPSVIYTKAGQLTSTVSNKG